MRGFISFLLVFAFLVIFLYSLFPLLSSFEFDQSKNIAIERAYSLEMNLKETILEGIREAAVSATERYLLTHPSYESFNLEELEEEIKESVQNKIIELDSFDSEDVKNHQLETDSLFLTDGDSTGLKPAESLDFEFEFFCGEPSSLETTSWKKKMLEQGKIEKCLSCEEFDSDSCKEIINVNFQLHTEPNSIPALSSISFGKEKVLLIAIYSKKFEVSSVSYIPISEVVSLE